MRNLDYRQVNKQSILHQEKSRKLHCINTYAHQLRFQHQSSFKNNSTQNKLQFKINSYSTSIQIRICFTKDVMVRGKSILQHIKVRLKLFCYSPINTSNYIIQGLVGDQVIEEAIKKNTKKLHQYMKLQLEYQQNKQSITKENKQFANRINEDHRPYILVKMQRAQWVNNDHYPFKREALLQDRYRRTSARIPGKAKKVLSWNQTKKSARKNNLRKSYSSGSTTREKKRISKDEAKRSSNQSENYIGNKKTRVNLNQKQ